MISYLNRLLNRSPNRSLNWDLKHVLHRARAGVPVMLGAALVLLALTAAQPLPAQSSKIMGELQFVPASDAETHAGVWIDGRYIGYLKELKGDKKIMLLPGEHQISVRRAGFADFSDTVVMEPAGIKVEAVQLMADNRALYPGSDAAEVKVDIKPKRAAVFVDDAYAGNAGEFGGHKAMLLRPGTHRLKVELPGYRTFETEIKLLPNQKTKVETELVPGSVRQDGTLISR